MTVHSDAVKYVISDKYRLPNHYFVMCKFYITLYNEILRFSNNNLGKVKTNDVEMIHSDIPRYKFKLIH